jgi:hypothetical protein
MAELQPSKLVTRVRFPSPAPTGLKIKGLDGKGMTKNGIFLSVVAAILAVIYAAYFTDWFRAVSIPIVAQTRVGRPMNIGRPTDEPPASVVSFLFDRAHRLTRVQVVAADDLATNKAPTALWSLVSDSASVPTKAFLYGLPIEGMKPALPRSHPQPLLPGIEYVIQVQAGKLKGRTNFVALEAVRIGGK